MPSAANLRFQDYSFQQPTPMGMWRWTTRVDLSGMAPAYSVRDIVSPYGLLRDSVPIPGPVVASMAESILQLRVNFAPALLASPLHLTFTLDEGRGFGVPQTVQVTNSGVFGSLLDAIITTDAGWVRTQPTRLGNLASGETGQFDVLVDSSSLLAADSPYTNTVLLQDAAAPNSPLPVTVTINVRPKAVIGVSTTALTFYAVKPLTGPFSPIPSQSFVLSNTGPAGSLLDFEVQKLVGSSPWLVSYTPMSGQLAGGSTQAMIVTVAPPPSCPPGTYKETLRISGYSSNAHQDVEVTLVIS